jgi:hypothetical protein
LIDKDKYSEDVAYIKLELPDGDKIILSPMTEFQKALETSNKVAITRFQFVNKRKELPNHLYLCTVGKEFFDLPEEAAQKIASMTGITISDFD